MEKGGKGHGVEAKGRWINIGMDERWTRVHNRKCVSVTHTDTLLENEYTVAYSANRKLLTVRCKHRD